MDLTAKQEGFCQAIITGMSHSDAYRANYSCEKSKPETIHRKAKELMDNGKVAARIEELRAPVVSEARLTLANHLIELDRLKRVAEGLENPSAAVKCEELRGKASGIYVDRIHHSGGIETGTKDLSRDELITIARRGSNGATTEGGRKH
jgi:phage terminase small subunit